jgi:hypothetical protein
MTDPSVSRANFEYANKLKREGYPTAVHALPPEALEFVRNELRKAISPTKIANKLNREFGTVIESYGLKPISKNSIASYRDSYFYKETALTQPLMQIVPDLNNRMLAAMEQFNSYGKMLQLARTQLDKATLIDEKETMMKMPIKRGDEARQLAFSMLSKIFQFEMDSGARDRAPTEINQRNMNLNILTTVSEEEKEMSLEELMDRTKKAIEALEEVKTDDGKSKPRATKSNKTATS